MLITTTSIHVCLKCLQLLLTIWFLLWLFAFQYLVCQRKSYLTMQNTLPAESTWVCCKLGSFTNYRQSLLPKRSWLHWKASTNHEEGVSQMWWRWYLLQSGSPRVAGNPHWQQSAVIGRQLKRCTNHHQASSQQQSSQSIPSSQRKLQQVGYSLQWETPSSPILAYQGTRPHSQKWSQIVVKSLGKTLKSYIAQTPQGK